MIPNETLIFSLETEHKKKNIKTERNNVNANVIYYRITIKFNLLCKKSNIENENRTENQKDCDRKTVVQQIKINVLQ